MALANVAAIYVPTPLRMMMARIRSFVLIVPFVAQVANNTVRTLASVLPLGNAFAITA